MPYGAQAAVATELGADKSVVSAIARGEYRAKTAPTKERVREIQQALAAQFDPPLPVWEVFEEWDGERPETQQEAPPATAKAS